MGVLEEEEANEMDDMLNEDGIEDIVDALEAELATEDEKEGVGDDDAGAEDDDDDGEDEEEDEDEDDDEEDDEEEDDDVGAVIDKNDKDICDDSTDIGSGVSSEESLAASAIQSPLSGMTVC